MVFPDKPALSGSPLRSDLYYLTSSRVIGHFYDAVAVFVGKHLSRTEGRDEAGVAGACFAQAGGVIGEVDIASKLHEANIGN